MSVNRQIILAARPVGYPKESDFNLVEKVVPSPGPGQMLIRIVYLSLDPYMRGLMSARESYAPALHMGDVMVGGTVGKVTQSNHPDFVKGDIVEGMLGWQEYVVSDGQGLRKVDPKIAPISTALGILGMPGLTAYFGFLDVASPKPGETIVISGAAGAVARHVHRVAFPTHPGAGRAVRIAVPEEHPPAAHHNGIDVGRHVAPQNSGLLGRQRLDGRGDGSTGGRRRDIGGRPTGGLGGHEDADGHRHTQMIAQPSRHGHLGDFYGFPPNLPPSIYE